MNRRERVRYEMLGRVSGFGMTHRDRFPPSSAGAATFSVIDDVLSDLQRHEMTRMSIQRDAGTVRANAKKLLWDRMLAVSRSSRAVRGESGALLRFQMPDRTSNIAIAKSARSFLRDAAPYREQLIHMGLPNTFLEELRDAADSFDRVMKDRRASRVQLANTQAAIKAAFSRGAEAVNTLNVVVTNTLGNDSPAMAGWERCRLLVGDRRRSSRRAKKAEG